LTVLEIGGAIRAFLFSHIPEWVGSDTINTLLSIKERCLQRTVGDIEAGALGEIPETKLTLSQSTIYPIISLDIGLICVGRQIGQTRWVLGWKGFGILAATAG